MTSHRRSLDSRGCSVGVRRVSRCLEQPGWSRDFPRASVVGYGAGAGFRLVEFCAASVLAGQGEKASLCVQPAPCPAGVTPRVRRARQPRDHVRGQSPIPHCSPARARSAPTPPGLILTLVFRLRVQPLPRGAFTGEGSLRPSLPHWEHW